MNRREFLRFVAASSAAVAAGPVAPTLAQSDTAQSKRKAPNIVFILADDLGYGDVGCLNPQRGKIPTPNIDRLAAAGMTFTEAHSGSAVCSPTRYGVLTGRYSWRTRLQAGIVGVFGQPLIASDRKTVGKLLQGGGYHTACVGKWHLGWDWPGERKYLLGSALTAQGKKAKGKTDPKDKPQDRTALLDEHREAWKRIFSQPIAGGPTTRGFDYYFGTDVPNWPPYTFIENDRVQAIPTTMLPSRLVGNNQASQHGPAAEGWRLEDILPALADKACAYIARQAAGDKPFFLYMPLTSPHTPLAVTDEWKGKSGLGLYADLVMETDAVVGRVLDALDKHKLADNTLVIFTSDNGCAPYIGVPEMEAKGHYPSGPYRGYKSDAWDGGHHVPFFARWPGVVRPGSNCSQLVCLTDLLATAGEIAGSSVPADAGEDSVSLLPLLRGQDKPVRDCVVHHSMSGRFAIRQGKWKLIFGPGSGGWSAPNDATAAKQGLPPVQLYDMEADVAEKVNLHDKHPQVVQRLTELMKKVIADGRSTPGPAQTNDVAVRFRPPG
ncbi:MAG: Arylsulfatase [Planctomycetes bacterium ADurb.Bin126]|nr:MAG: Arylsulfatase [Planctomycetes bacterium ADurb.Bin126]HOD81206.1 arylsulfatase [Phycisphaerae bacterium]HQL71770.1 arylsulfatase [Phycisphaerae bacterium]